MTLPNDTLEQQLDTAIKSDNLQDIKSLFSSTVPSSQPSLLKAIAVKAAQATQIPTLEWAFSAGFQPPLKSLNDDLFEAACYARSTAVWDVLLAHGYDPNAHESEFAGDALCIAAFHGDVAVFRYMLEHGADPNAQHDLSERYASVWAATCEKDRAAGVEMLRLLLRYGWRNRGEGAHVAAAETGNLEALRVLVEGEGGGAPADLEEVEAWWHNATVVEPNEWGTALYRAALKGQAEAVRYLLEKGANPQFKDGKGRSCLWAARTGGNEQVLRLIQEAGVEA